MSFNRDTPWARHLVNLNQTAQERQNKYQLARQLGASVPLAQRMRDWREPKIKRAFRVKEENND